MRHCTKCGHKTRANSSLCANCKRLERKYTRYPRHCSDCGTHLRNQGEQGELYCPKCQPEKEAYELSL